MLPDEPRFEATLGTTFAALVLLTLGGPALAGQGGNLQPVATLLLELDASTSQFRLDDADATTTDPVQLIFDQKIFERTDACLVGLTPDGSDPTDPNALVSLAESPTDWGIDEGKFALGGRTGRGTGCGQLEKGEILRFQVNSLLLGGGRVQVEAKQDASAKLTLILDDGVAETVVGTRYLLSGRAANNPPAEVVAACAPVPVSDCSLVSEILGRTDGGPDSKEQDDGFWVLNAPIHNVEVYEILTNADGTEGKLSIKGGGEFPDPGKNRSEWPVFEIDGRLNCGDGFSCEGDEDCTSDGASGNRTNVGTGDACADPIAFDLKFDGQEVTFEFLDASSQDPGIALDVQWQTEGAQFPIDPTVLSYDPDGVACQSGSCSNDATSCQSNSDCDPGNTCVLPVTESCIPLTLCVGTPVRRCSNDPSLGCREDGDCGPGNTCRLADLEAPAAGFPDLLPASATVEYGCVCEEDVLYLGPGVCDDLSGDLAGSSCEDDSGCGTGGTCELFGRCDGASGALAGDSCGDNTGCVDGANEGACVFGEEIAVEQCLFFTGDAKFGRGRKNF